MSVIRMKNRQHQPISVYHDELTNSKLINPRWTTN